MPTKTAVAWCTGCEHYLPADEIGQSCPTLWGAFGVDHKRKLRKRVGYIDSQCEEQPIFFKREDYKAHVREDH